MDQALELECDSSSLPVNQVQEKSLPSCNRINKELAYLMALQGKTGSQIAAYFSVSEPAVSKALKPYKELIELYTAIKQGKDVYLEGKQLLLLDRLRTDVINKMSGKDLVVATGILQDKIQVLRGEPTQIVNYQDATKSLNQMLQEYQELTGQTLDVVIEDDNNGT